MNKKKARADASSEAPGQTPKEYALEHGLTLDWVYRLIGTGRLPIVRMFGRLFITGTPIKHEREKRNA